tara:strand:- start:5993 stop:7732 length:1740 start_codon:yes stop_codon:yes gene_type:complete
MVKIPDIDNLTRTRLAATPNAPANLTVSPTAFSGSMQNLAASTIKTGDAIAAYATAIQDKKNKSLSNEVLIESKKQLNSYENELYRGAENDDGTFTAYEPSEYESLLEAKKNEIIQNVIKSDSRITSGVLRDSIITNFNLEYLSNQRRVLKEANTRIQKSFVMESMNLIDVYSQDLGELSSNTNLSGEDLILEIAAIENKVNMAIEGMSDTVAATTLIKTKEDFYKNAANVMWQRRTHDMPIHQLITLVDNINTFGIKNAASEFAIISPVEAYTFSKLGLSNPEAVQQIFDASIDAKMSVIDNIDKINKKEERIVKKEQNKLIRGILLTPKDDDNFDDVAGAYLDELEKLDPGVVEASTILKMRSYVNGETVFADTTVQSVYNNLLHKITIGQATFAEVMDATGDLTQEDFKYLMSRQTSILDKTERRLQGLILGDFGYAEQQVTDTDDELLNIIAGVSAQTQNEYNEWLLNNRDVAGSLEDRNKVKELRAKAKLDIKEAIILDLNLAMQSIGIDTSNIDFNDLPNLLNEINKKLNESQQNETSITLDNGTIIPKRSIPGLKNFIADKSKFIKKLEGTK